MKASRDREKANQNMTQILHRLETIEKQQDQVIADLRKYLNDRVDDAVQQLFEYLSSEETKTRYTTLEFIDEWEEDNKVCTNACQDVLQHFQQRCNFVEGELRNLRDAATADRPDGFVEKRKSLAENVSLLFRLTFFFVTSNFDIIRLRQGKNELMTQVLGHIFRNMYKSSLRVAVWKLFKPAVLGLNQIESHITELIQADKMLYEDLKLQSFTQRETQDLFRPIMNEGSRLRGQLVVFGIKEVRSPDISDGELAWKEDAPSRLGCGAFGAVYQGTLRKNGQTKTVALKAFSDVLDDQNACSIMEVETLR